MSIFKKEEELRINAVAVIVCGGQSTRMKGIDKINLELEGLPLWAWSVLAFEKSERVSSVVLVTKEEDIGDFWSVVRELGLKKVRSIVRGGATRQESVSKGFFEAKKLSENGEDFDVIAIHDGARPFIKTETIDQAVFESKLYGGSCVAIKSRDTVKVLGEGDFVKETLDRDKIILAQTPQCFQFSLYEKAFNNALEEKKTYTDDCQLFEAMGRKVHITKGDSQNIKITTREDLFLARGIFEAIREEP